MCFSAEVSFGASAVISTTGALTLKKSKTKGQKLFAMIPLMFGIQQFMEGCLWIALKNKGYAALEQIATYGFLSFAQLIWPVWIPLSIYAIEENPTRKKILAFTLVLGSMLFFLLGYRMAVYDVTAQIDNFHIFYTVGDFQSTNWWSGIFYLLPAAVPFLISSTKQINILGILMIFMFVVAKIFYIKYMISVWCLFAALLSWYIYFILKRKNATVVA